MKIEIDVPDFKFKIGDIVKITIDGKPLSLQIFAGEMVGGWRYYMRSWTVMCVDTQYSNSPYADNMWYHTIVVDGYLSKGHCLSMQARELEDLVNPECILGNYNGT